VRSIVPSGYKVVTDPSGWVVDTDEQLAKRIRDKMINTNTFFINTSVINGGFDTIASQSLNHQSIASW
jgi:hypothetical protein